MPPSDPPTSPTTSTTRRGGLRQKRQQTGQRQQKDHATHGDDDDSDDARDFSAAANEGAADTIVVLAHVQDKLIPVHCGFGTQQVEWLGHVAIARYDEERHQGWRELGAPVRIVKDGKEELRLDAIIYDVLTSHSHVYVTTSRSS